MLSAVTLWVLKWLDQNIPREHRALLALRANGGGIPDLDALVSGSGFRAYLVGKRKVHADGEENLCFEMRWTRSDARNDPSRLLALVESRYTVDSFEMATEALH